MSPEQAQGKKVDTRSDIFSFGVVLYEMVTGARAFEGDSALSTLSAILRDEARPVAEFAPDAPPQLEMVIQRCLRKNPDERWQTMKEVQMALSALKHESDSGTLYRARLTATSVPPVPSASAAKVAKERKNTPVWAALAGGALALTAVVGGGVWWTRHRTPPAPVEQAAAPQPPPTAAPEPTPAPEPPPSATDKPMTNDDVVADGRGQGVQHTDRRADSRFRGHSIRD